jgi:CO/xanthine dehydrogenase Mo-binding subunit
LAINPLSLESQIEGAVVQGIGWALMEKYILVEGRVQNSNLLDYRLPTAVDAPPVEVILVESPSESGIYGLKHAGEPPMIPAPAAMAIAISRAVGVRFYQLPVDPETVLNGIKARRPPTIEE